MTTRLLSAAMALLTGLLAVFLLDLALSGSGVLAQEKKNCPAGFNWVRLSGTGCVQEQLPSHGKIGYDGTSICEDGYSGTYERRATTDGQPAPGTPYTSFAYLTECVSTAVGASAIGGDAFSGTAGDVAEQLYDSGGGPSNSDLALVGVGCGFGFGLATWGTFVLGAGAGGPTWIQSLLKVDPGARAKRLEFLDKLHASWLHEEYLMHDEIQKAREELRELERELRAMEKVLRFARYHYWKRIPAFASLGTSVAALTLLGLMLRPEMTIATWKKVLLAGSAGSLMYSKASYPVEEAKLIAKIKPKVDQLRTKVWQKNYEVQALEKEMQRIRNEAAKVRKDMRSLD